MRDYIPHTVLATRVSSYTFQISKYSTLFQAYINKALTGLLDVIYVVYLDILIYSQDQSPISNGKGRPPAAAGI